MDIIELYFNNFKLGELTYKKDTYFFKSDRQANNLLLRKDDTFLKPEGTDNVKEFKSLPALFHKFLPKEDKKTEELMNQVGIYKEDNDFQKLLKISRLDLSKESFWIRVKEIKPKKNEE